MTDAAASELSATAGFHPALARWFTRTFGSATPAQAEAWPAVRSGRDVLVAAPTGSGKTLAAFLAAIDDLVRRAQDGPLPDETAIVYVSPLKALSNDIRRNLEAPLAGIEAELAAEGARPAGIRTLVRTGDTPQAERAGMKKRPPHIVITTPESLAVLLGSASGRAVLSTTRAVIVDEIHAIAGAKRGSHLALSLERLEHLAGRPIVRIGLSATQKPIERVARFLVGRRYDTTPPVIVDAGHVRARDLGIEVPPAPLEAVMSGDVWEQVYDRLAALVLEHRTTLVFVNTRRHAERVTRHLAERLGAEHVAAHHGSLAKERRFDAEQRLKAGELRALVATASLELGIDIGDVDLVCQIGAARSIATFLQRAGRAGHSVGGTPKARLFPLSRDELAEHIALLDAIRRGELDRVIIPAKPLDVLAQQIVAEVATSDDNGWDEDALYALVTGADPYRDLTREEHDSVVKMLVEGFGTRRGRARQYLHHDAVNRRLRPRKGARLIALTSSGAIPDNADYDVVMEPSGGVVGTLNEDFAIESLAGDIFQLGNTSYRILRIEAGRVRVEDAHGQAPNIPFWLGEAPGRSDELSHAVSRFRAEWGPRIESDPSEASAALTTMLGIEPAASRQLVDYLAAGQKALGVLPTAEVIVLERFFDESGGMQLVVHSPLGSRLNRAWGLALRKRFCVKFNFELQAAATEDAIVLSLSTSHSFPLGEVARYLNARTVREVLIQALLLSPMFTARWRWNASIALAVPRFRGGKKVAPNLQRMDAEDLIAHVFPDQIACAENIDGPREVPDHPLATQTVHDCLYEAMDLAGLERLLERIASGEVAMVARDVTEPSPFAAEVLSARPYAFLDDAPLEERRTRAVMSRRWTDVEEASDLGALDPEAIARVREEAAPAADNAEELHDALLGYGALTNAEVAAHPEWAPLVASLVAAKRATRSTAAGVVLWIAAERLPRMAAIRPDATLEPPIDAPPPYSSETWTPEDATRELIRGRLQASGPITVSALGAPLGLRAAAVTSALAALESEGFVFRGRFTAGAVEEEWCERALVARIHRYTLARLRREIEPASAQDFMRFLAEWQHVAPADRKDGPDALAALVADLEGFEAPAAAWETEILPARLAQYDFTWLDDLCSSGRAAWLRLTRPRPADDAARRAGPVRTTPIAILPRRNAAIWIRAAVGLDDAASAPVAPGPRAARVVDFLAAHGASFFDEIAGGVNLLPVEAEDALGELVALGRVTSDSFAGLRALLVPSDRRRTIGASHGRRKTAAFGIQDAGRWSLLRAPTVARPDDPDPVESIARTLLRRYGVIAWRLLAREAAWLPPWRDLLRVLRRLEARGEIRGGRFVASITGEQYALPEAVTKLREVRRRPPADEWIAVSGADPLNLVGLVGPGDRVPALAANRVLYRDGIAIAVLAGGEVRYLVPLDAPTQARAKDALVVRSGLAPALAFLR